MIRQPERGERAGYAAHLTPPIRIRGPRGPWQDVRYAMERAGNATVLTTWGEWLSTALTESSLRPLLGRDWQPFRRTSNPVVRYRFAASRLALKYAAGVVLGTDPTELDLSYAIDGRPYLRGLSALEVSISHAEDLIAVSLCRSGRIGVDTEPTTADVDAEVLRSHACTAAERELLDRLPTAERDARLLRLWTLKEAYTKALGQGLRFGFTEFGFAPHGTGAGGLRTPEGTSVDSAEWTFTTWSELGGRYLVSVACQKLAPASPADLAAAPLLDTSVIGALTEELRRDRSPRGDEDVVERCSADRGIDTAYESRVEGLGNELAAQGTGDQGQGSDEQLTGQQRDPWAPRARVPPPPPHEKTHT